MDFLPLCQALGVAISVGLIVGSVLPPVMPTWGVVAGAAPIGILAGVVILSGEDDPIWPAFVTGIVGGGLAATVSRDIASGAARRARGATDAGGPTTAPIAAFIFLVAVVTGALSLLVPPVALVVFVALLWMLVNRRRTAEQKHEGLRVLR